MSMSGCGRSSWRDRYEVTQLAREMFEVAHVTGLHEAGPPVFVAHSFGSRPLFNAAASGTQALRAAVVLDAAVSLPRPAAEEAFDPRPHRSYTSFEEALTRFRLMPYQVCDNAFILDYIARQSLHTVTTEGEGERWTWRSDPFAFRKLSGAADGEAETALRSARCTMAFLTADRSAIVRADNLAHTRAAAPPGTIFATIPDAGHHVFLDQPLAVVAALRLLLETLA